MPTWNEFSSSWSACSMGRSQVLDACPTRTRQGTLRHDPYAAHSHLPRWQAIVRRAPSDTVGQLHKQGTQWTCLLCHQTHGQPVPGPASQAGLESCIAPPVAKDHMIHTVHCAGMDWLWQLRPPLTPSHPLDYAMLTPRLPLGLSIRLGSPAHPPRSHQTPRRLWSGSGWSCR